MVESKSARQADWTEAPRGSDPPPLTGAPTEPLPTLAVPSPGEGMAAGAAVTLDTSASDAASLSTARYLLEKWRKAEAEVTLATPPPAQPPARPPARPT